MAYTLTYSIGTITVIDTTLNTQTSLSLPGRNYAGYGQPVDQNQVSLLENFASYPVTGPANPIPGQTWFDSDSVTFNVNISSTSTPNWETLVTTGSANVSFGNLIITGELTVTDITTGGASIPGNITGLWSLTTGSTMNFSNGTFITDNITTGSNITAGALTGGWSLTNGSSMNFSDGTLTTDNITTGSNVTVGIMAGAWSITNGSSMNFSNGTFTTDNITTGSNITGGNITGNWTLTAGSQLNATYADLGERFEADAEYDAGTVMELGGDAEITAVRDELSDIIFGVVSESAGMIMNGSAGPSSTHPIIAMTGRVPVKVRGIIKKGDRLVSAGQGFARAAKKNEATPFNTVGRSLENKTTNSEGTVLAAVSAKL
jgi:hypothetical protein